MNDYMFGSFLFELRTQKGLSQSQLGEMLGVTNKAVSKWENGSTKPNTNLLPKIAEIFEVTVEELFACKRVEKDAELNNIKEHIYEHKKKYALLSSIFLSLIIILPMMLIEFICVVEGFHLPDDVLGPLGSVFFILAFIVSVTSYVIYRNNFKRSWPLEEREYPQKFVKIIKNGIWISVFTMLSLLVLLLPIYFAILAFSSGFMLANIYLLIAILAIIILLGMFIFFANVKRLLKIKLSEKSSQERKRVSFSEMPIFIKICYIGFIIIFPFVFVSRIVNLLSNNNELSVASTVSLMICSVLLLVVALYQLKRK